MSDEKELSFCPNSQEQYLAEFKRRINREYNKTGIMLLVMAGTYAAAGIYLLSILFQL